MQPELFTDERDDVDLGPGARLLAGFALEDADALIAAIETIARDAPFRHLIVPGGHRMSVAMTNAGSLGWVSDTRGYRYDAIDPGSGRRWPVIPPLFGRLAASAAAALGFDGFAPDACLINRYIPGARLSLHQDRDEGDFGAPIVSVSLGLPATFLWGGLKRNDRPRRVPVQHGDVVVWGGPSRMVYHGVAPVPSGTHPATGEMRYNLTFRRAR